MSAYKIGINDFIQLLCLHSCLAFEQFIFSFLSSSETCTLEIGVYTCVRPRTHAHACIYTAYGSQIRKMQQHTSLYQIVYSFDFICCFAAHSHTRAICVYFSMRKWENIKEDKEEIGEWKINIRRNYSMIRTFAISFHFILFVLYFLNTTLSRTQSAGGFPAKGFCLNNACI